MPDQIWHDPGSRSGMTQEWLLTEGLLAVEVLFGNAVLHNDIVKVDEHHIVKDNAVPEGNRGLYIEEVSRVVCKNAVVKEHVVALVNVNQLELAVTEELAGIENDVL